ncbi:helix-turn-helix domain-containing protein [Streptomyces sp. NPDC002755]|uniref:helix-turn-helix domain-containing protein n=1 Tax=Streptomyces sp. NPDC002884 TaxID=3154544 RepID=UPI00331C7E85
MARPEQALERDGSPLREFAFQLRSARAASGLTYAQLATRTTYSVSTLQEAASGRRLPTLAVTLAFVKACREDTEEWQARWEQVRAMPHSKGHADLLVAVVAEDVAPGAGTGGKAADGTAPQERRKHVHSPPKTGRLWLICTISVALATAGACAAIFTSSHPPADASDAVIVVQNKVAIGPNQLVEDSTPAYLSSRTVSRCARRGCKLVDTDFWSGAKLVATCWTRGERLTNQDAGSDGIQRNKNRVTSDLWYRAVWPDGRSGYLAEVYVVVGDRGGLGLGRCSARGY